MNNVQRTVASVGFLLGLYWLACGALMFLRPDLVAPQAIDPLHFNHGATLLGILSILLAVIALVSCLILFVRSRSQANQRPLLSESVQPARALAFCLVILGGIAIPLIVLVPNLAIVWFVLLVLGAAGLPITIRSTSPSTRV